MYNQVTGTCRMGEGIRLRCGDEAGELRGILCLGSAVKVSVPAWNSD